MSLGIRAAALAAACVFTTGGALAQADPNKVLKVAFLIAETGFDPQASSDLYSNYVNRVIFDSLYRYDYIHYVHRWECRQRHLLRIQCSIGSLEPVAWASSAKCQWRKHAYACAGPDESSSGSGGGALSGDRPAWDRATPRGGLRQRRL